MDLTLQYLLVPYNEKQEFFAWWDNGFTNEELNWLQAKAMDSKYRAEVGGANSAIVNLDIRRTGLNWLRYNEENSWVFKKIGHIVSSLNAQFFRFDLTGFGEDIQLGNYDSSELGMYGWHIDRGVNPIQPSRKLSVVLQLTDPVEYEGGVLELKPYGEEIIRMKKQRGSLVVFPSWTLHQVTPVTQGSRQSLVSWITGPAFK